MRKHNPADNGVQLPFTEQEFIDKWAEWLEDRKERRIKNYTIRGLKGALKNLAQIADNDPQKAVAIIQQSIDHGWQGLFKLKNQYHGATHQSNTTGIGTGTEKLGTSAARIAVAKKW